MGIDDYPKERIEFIDYVHKCGSDCHYAETVGTGATYFQNEIKTLDDLIQAIRNHECKPAFNQDYKYFVWDIDHLLF